MKVAPLRDWITVKREAMDQSPGGIAIPDNVKGKTSLGTVITAGPEIQDERVKVGATVMFGLYDGYPFTLRADIANEFIAMSERMVIAVIED